jgi:hypothetical protein
LIEWELVLMQMRTAQVVLWLAIQLPVAVVLRAILLLVLAMLWMLMLAIERMVVLVARCSFLFLCTENKFFDRAAEWFVFLGAHVKAAMISLNSRLCSSPEYEAGWSPQSHTVATYSKESPIAYFRYTASLSTFNVGGSFPSSCKSSVFSRVSFNESDEHKSEALPFPLSY